MSKLTVYLKLIRFNKPIGTLLLLWPTLTALFIASNGKPPVWILFVFVCGTFLVRSAGCIVNDFFDREFDKHVERTKDRPIAVGAIKPIKAITVCLLLFLIAFLLVLTLNAVTIIMAAIALILACLYPLMKRITHIPQVWLGIAFNWGILMAFTATDSMKGYQALVAMLLYLAALLFTVAYDTQYAMVDREDDLKLGLKSTAILFGRYDRLIILMLQLVALVLLLYVGVIMKFDIWFNSGLLVALLMIIYQQYLIKEREPRNCFKAFLSNHWLLLFIFLGVVL